MENSPGAADDAAFAQALSALKERGSNLLVVGNAIECAHVEACDRLLGEANEQPRRRLFVRTDGSSGCGLQPARGGAPERTRVVVQATETRSAAAPTGGDQVPTMRVGRPDVDALSTAVLDAVDALAEHGGFEPAELRLCFDSLMPLLAEHDQEEVVEMLERVTGRVRELDGMGHFHLPVDRNAAAVERLQPLFDAVIRLRVRDEQAEHCWRLVDQEIESGWLPL